MWVKRSDAYKIFAVKFPDLEDKLMENWFWAELDEIRQSKRIGYDDKQLEALIKKVEDGLIYLTIDDYKICINFAIESFYHSVVKSDFGGGRQRDLGQFLTNHAIGKLGEIALKKLLEKFGLEIELDFVVTGEIPSQDITRVSIRKKIWDNPSAKISIKATKIRNVFMAIPERETELTDRVSDVYVLTQVGVPPDHFLRALKGEKVKLLEKVEKLIPDFKPTPCRVSGWISLDDLKKTKVYSTSESESYVGVAFSSPNYILTPRQLSQDWTSLCKNIYKGWKPPI
jgi:hypothetical protein